MKVKELIKEAEENANKQLEKVKRDSKQGYFWLGYLEALNRLQSNLKAIEK